MSCLEIAEQPYKIITANNSFLTVCSDSQFSTFNLQPFARIHHSLYVTFSQGVSLDDGRSVFVGRREHGRGNCLYLWERGDIIKELNLDDNIESVTSSGREVLVLLKYQAIIISHNLEVISKIETGDNDYVIGDISDTVVCIPDSNTGTLTILSLLEPRSLFIYAHDHPIRSVSLSPSGSLLATASTQGTLIRVFDTRTGSCVNQLRVSWMQSDIYSLAVSKDDKYVAAVSRDGNLYIFNLEVIPSLFSIYSYSCTTDLYTPGKLVFTDKKTLHVITHSECLTFEIESDRINCINRNQISNLAEEWVLLD
jgi:WD40 repeat protein